MPVESAGYCLASFTMEVKQIEQIGFRVRISRRDETMLDFGLSVLIQFFANGGGHVAHNLNVHIFKTRSKFGFVSLLGYQDGNIFYARRQQALAGSFRHGPPSDFNTSQGLADKGIFPRAGRIEQTDAGLFRRDNFSRCSYYYDRA